MRDTTLSVGGSQWLNSQWHQLFPQLCPKKKKCKKQKKWGEFKLASPSETVLLLHQAGLWDSVKEWLPLVTIATRFTGARYHYCTLLNRSCQLSCARWLTLIRANRRCVHLRAAGLIQYAAEQNAHDFKTEPFDPVDSRFCWLHDLGYLHRYDWVTRVQSLIQHCDGNVIQRLIFVCASGVGWISCLPPPWTDYWSD